MSTIIKQKYTLTLFFLLCNIYIYSQSKKSTAIRIKDPIYLDGHLSEIFWSSIQPANNFYQDKPYNGAPANFKVDVRFAYDNQNIYVGAYIKDDPDSISVGLGDRDSQPQADRLGIWFDTFNDNLNASGFVVFASNVQRDVSISASGADVNWNEVWYSQTAILDSGWSAEIQIPYSALRFPAKNQQTWGLNIYYGNHRTQELDSWSLVDTDIAGFVNQFGELNGLENIKPPLRLAFMPYVSGYADKFGTNSIKYSYKAGMDVKYGINESFTLNMMLIPDFGQVQSDNLVLNLGPYEVKYKENRTFFTEGAGLFNNSNIFYSKRIGARPVDHKLADDNLSEHETVGENPQSTGLINATKVTGKTKSGLSLGILNAVSENTYAIIEDSLTGNQRKFKTQPLTNYNIIAFEQVLKNNSYVGLANTNMTYSGFMANVTAASFNFKNRQNSHEISGRLIYSHRNFTEAEDETGYHYDINFKKIIGNFRYQASRKHFSEMYNVNDMGFTRRNNFIHNTIVLEYKTFDPFWKVLQSSNKFHAVYLQRIIPQDFLNFYLMYESEFTFSNYAKLKFLGWIRPKPMHNYFETRVKERYYLEPKQGFVKLQVESDKRKKLSYMVSANYRTGGDYNYHQYGLALNPTLTLSDKLNLNYKISFDKNLNSRNFVSKQNNGAIINFGERNNTVFNNAITGNYSVSHKSYISLKVRHYWSEAIYDSFFTLNQDGSLLSNKDYLENENINFNVFNVDLSYTWRFAPGSECIMVWKNSISSKDDNVFFNSYQENLNYTLSQPQFNSLSFKLLYYLDYNKVSNLLSQN
ncbi:carbohydrate binding family 9 domain-containing protein [Labilibacter sediminis]|nr:carbohydrate binding family 9 domain-containing protein [Labilibacter sediminis]